jgi:alpha-L-fucosidase
MLAVSAFAQAPAETAEQRDARMAWWREARFGMFIHWGVYAVPAGEWGGKTSYGEWIRDSARIPLDEYDKFRERFNPVKFDAQAWVSMAKAAGMKYIVITSKHHDGFCMFPSQHTDWDIAATPFPRDPLKELAAACDSGGVKLCFYHSIMDWHHPDYLPRRPWETTRSAEGADYDRYVAYMKGQLRELLTNYGPIGVLWFDGEWEGTWNHERGVDLYRYVRSLQPAILINNRVDVFREGMAGLSRSDRAVGDFGTPEQEIPATGLPGVDWETCMTMNDNWGYNRADRNFKTSADLLRKLSDIASKGGNFLLNIGPTADGEFPPESVQRLAEIGAWMKVNGEAIHGTQAGPFKSLPWGRCTMKTLPGGDTRLYAHVFDWPADGVLRIAGLLNEARRATLLGTPGASIEVSRQDESLVLRLPLNPPDSPIRVIALDIAGPADVNDPPVIAAPSRIFVDSLAVTLSSPRVGVEFRYTLDGTEPGLASPRADGPLTLTQSATLKARAFRDGKPVSGVSEAAFERVAARPADAATDLTPGLHVECYEGSWDKLPDFDSLTPARRGTTANVSLSARTRDENFGLRLRGFVRIPARGVYTFWLASDDGSRLRIGGVIVVDNDGLHGTVERSGQIALDAGVHAITLEYFEKTGNDGLELRIEGPSLPRGAIPDALLLRN